jgi:hypothetical protein
MALSKMLAALRRVQTATPKTSNIPWRKVRAQTGGSSWSLVVGKQDKHAFGWSSALGLRPCAINNWALAHEVASITSIGDPCACDEKPVSAIYLKEHNYVA